MNDELGDDDDGDGDDEEKTYEWHASGESCALCDALDGMTFTSPPPVPVHPHCNCEVRPGRGRYSESRSCENSWSVRTTRSEWTGGYPGHVSDHLTVHVDVEVICWDDTTITDTIDVDFGINPDIDIETFADEVWALVSDHVEELAGTKCPACQPIPVS